MSDSTENSASDMDDDLIDDGWDGNDEGDWSDDDSPAETIPCPACGIDVYEEADQCPACGEFIVGETAVLADKPTWYVVLAVLGIIAVLIALSGLAGVF
ncbi:MAG: hypothetical protein HON53_04205 [Planctomycetaceae bacterium]|nr:hypothetical protein [Planctomycetaceae bacterium]MBT6156761.1 hypothetical protein [Planctomycetaceae bacterium]MBT6487716.1 hypothetical protein [Planctomycetaceae bacterium]MBT6494191.1 hypothetical protein [Planctomycetaceae bacterium]